MHKIVYFGDRSPEDKGYATLASVTSPKAGVLIPQSPILIVPGVWKSSTGHNGNIPKMNIDLVKKSVATSASLHILQCTDQGTQHKSMVKPALKVEGYTSWSTHSITSY